MYVWFSNCMSFTVGVVTDLKFHFATVVLKMQIIIIMACVQWTKHMFGKILYLMCVSANLFRFLWILFVIKRSLVHAKRPQKRWERGKNDETLFFLCKSGLSVQLNGCGFRFNIFIPWWITTNLSSIRRALLHLCLRVMKMFSENTYLHFDYTSRILNLLPVYKVWSKFISNKMQINGDFLSEGGFHLS